MSATGQRIESMWTWARNRHGVERDRRTPSAGMVALLLELRGGPAYGSELARRTGALQHNVTSYWLPKLDRYGFVTVVETRPGVGGGRRVRGHGGARPAVFWALTRAGRELAGLLETERGAGC